MFSLCAFVFALCVLYLTVFGLCLFVFVLCLIGSVCVRVVNLLCVSRV